MELEPDPADLCVCGHRRDDHEFAPLPFDDEYYCLVLGCTCYGFADAMQVAR